VCLTLCFVTTEVLIFDYLKFDAKRELLDQATRVLQQRQSSLEQPPL
jgi:hypothetical protein